VTPVKWVPWVLSMALSALAARSASASVVNVQFHGAIDTVLNPELLAGSDIGIGTLFSGDVFVDSTGATLLPAGAAYPGSPAVLLAGAGLTSIVQVDAEVGTVARGDPAPAAELILVVQPALHRTGLDRLLLHRPRRLDLVPRG